VETGGGKEYRRKGHKEQKIKRNTGGRFRSAGSRW
jgi:hypothetical protein